MKLKFIGFCSLVFLMSLVNIFRPEISKPQIPDDCMYIITDFRCDEEPDWQFIDITTSIPNKAFATTIYEGQQFKYKDKLYVFDCERFVLVVDEPSPETNETRIFLPHHRGCEQDGEFDAVYCPECDGIFSDSKYSEITIPKEHSRSMGLGDITNLIPTWPDYIELDKDLVIGMSHKNDPNDITYYWADIIFEKGTKIYFKEEE